MVEARLDLDGCSVLDLYAGSGALGLEALSRGAGRALLVDRAAVCARIIEANALAVEVAIRCEVWRLEVSRALVRLAEQARSFDLVCADPPYVEDPAALLASIEGAAVVASGGFLLLEHASRSAAPDASGSLALEVRRRHGDTALSLYRRG